MYVLIRSSAFFQVSFFFLVTLSTVFLWICKHCSYKRLGTISRCAHKHLKLNWPFSRHASVGNFKILPCVNPTGTLNEEQCSLWTCLRWVFFHSEIIHLFVLSCSFVINDFLSVMEVYTQKMERKLKKKHLNVEMVLFKSLI